MGKRVKIELKDIHDNNWEFEGEDLTLSVEGVTTLVLKPNKQGNLTHEILGSFINVAGSQKTEVEE